MENWLPWSEGQHCKALKNGLWRRVGLPCVLSRVSPPPDPVIRSECLHTLPKPPATRFVQQNCPLVVATTVNVELMHRAVCERVLWENSVLVIPRSDGEFPHKERSGLRLTDSFWERGTLLLAARNIKTKPLGSEGTRMSHIDKVVLVSSGSTDGNICSLYQLAQIFFSNILRVLVQFAVRYLDIIVSLLKHLKY